MKKGFYFMGKALDASVFSSMQTKEPYKSYKKVCLGKLHVSVLNPFTGEPEGMIVAGNPVTEPEKCILDMWSEMEDAFFKRMNRRHLDAGYLVGHVRKVLEPVENPNTYSDEELRKLLNSKFMALKNAVSRMTSDAPVARLITLAQELEKSEKIMKFLEGRLSEIQLQEYGGGEEMDE
jgi:hypothetical protein